MYDVPASWNACDAWPTDIYSIYDYGDGIEVTQVVADYVHTDEVEYVVEYVDDEAVIYWYTIND
jgi:hypothetical protein